ncbi:tumor necrosis factor ligand superfamily member 10 [Callorhinchus milii]|nr:tumor necrosis factor (ligand) superfamily, member 10 like 4 [Callorhinchus milii]
MDQEGKMSSSMLVDYSYQKLSEKITDSENRKWRALVLILGLIICLQTSTAFYFFLRFTRQMAQMKQKVNVDSSPGRCLKYLNTYTGDPSDFEESIEDLGCDRWLNNIRFLINQRLQFKVKDMIYQELKANNATYLLGSDTPAIHLTIRRSKDPLSPSNASSYLGHGAGHEVLYWEDNKGLALRHSSIEYHEGEMSILKSGLYYVYAKVYLRHIPGREAVNHRDNPSVQYIYKKTSSYYDPILLTKSVFTRCWSKEGMFDLYTSYQGALFQLEEGDKLFMMVTDASVVDVNDESTYFGAFMIQ